jgi:cytochrome P450
MAWVILSMILYPEVQKKAQMELDRVVGRDRLPSFQDLDHLPYIHAILKEIMRWRGVGPLGESSCHRSLLISLTVAKGFRIG